MRDDMKKTEILKIFSAEVITGKTSSQNTNARLQNSMIVKERGGEEQQNNGTKQMPLHQSSSEMLSKQRYIKNSLL